jgi:hypothetical protein
MRILCLVWSDSLSTLSHSTGKVQAQHSWKNQGYGVIIGHLDSDFDFSINFF